MVTDIREGLKHTAGAPFAWPSGDAFEEIVRKARRAATDARHATEDLAAGASLEVRRHPLTAVGLASAAGLLTGVVVGIGAGWYLTRRMKT
jgi:hypothetical protein